MSSSPENGKEERRVRVQLSVRSHGGRERLSVISWPSGILVNVGIPFRYAVFLS
jgi:hypothetical protein